MTTVASLIESAKKALKAKSDAEFASELGVSRGTVANWKSGYSHPDTVACATLAGLTGEPLARVLGIVGEARAISREEKAVWRRLATTAAVFLVVGLVVPTDAIARTTTGVSGSPGYALCEVTRRLMEWLQAGLCSLLDRSQGKYRHGTSAMLG